MIIRKIRDGEMPLLVDGGARYHTMIDIGQFDPNVFVTTWESILKMTDSFVLVAQEDNGFVAGGLGCIVSGAHSTGEKIATIGFWFVHPEHRGTAGGRLFKIAERLSKDLGADRVNALLTITAGTPKIEASLVRQGYRPLELVYTKVFARSLDSGPSPSDPTKDAESPDVAVFSGK